MSNYGNVIMICSIELEHSALILRIQVVDLKLKLSGVEVCLNNILCYCSDIASHIDNSGYSTLLCIS